jgi:chemotaxis protein CheC
MATMSIATTTDTESWNAIFAPAAEKASSALARWTSGRIRLELDDVNELGVERLAEFMPTSSATATTVIVSIAGDFGGQLILIFEDVSAQTLVESLLNRPVGDLVNWGELEWSVLRETGNICASAFLSSMRSYASQTTLLPSPPQIVRDFVPCILEQAILPQLMENDSLLWCHTRMTREGEPIAFSSLFVPAPLLVSSLRSVLSTASHAYRGSE